MKHITLCAALILAAHTEAQNLFTSSFESWSGATPDGWVGSKTSLENDSIQQADQNIQFGNFAVRLVNTESGHKRFTTTSLTVEDGQAYNISFYARGSGEIRTGLFDGRSTGFGYATYNAYNIVSGSTWTPYTQQVVAANDTTGAEFILSVRNTMAGSGHIEVDSVRISPAVPVPPTDATVYAIQFTTDPNGDSPLLGQTVNSGGIVSAVASNGYWIQSGNGPWSGIFVFDFDHVPARGDSLTLTGVVDEFNGLSELKTITNFTVVNSGNNVAPQWLATGSVGQEEWEGVLAQVTMANCTAPADGNGEWTIDDGTGALQVNDVMYAFLPNVGSQYDVTGVVNWSFGSWKIEPRDMNDISLSSGVQEEAFAGTVLFPLPTNGSLRYRLPVSGLAFRLLDLSGRELHSGSLDLSGALDLAGHADGTYVLQLTDGTRVRSERVVLAR